MRVYVATRFGMWQDAHTANVTLRAAGHVPTAQWVGIAAELEGKCDAVPVGTVERKDNARMDLEDLDRSDALIVLVPSSGGTGMWVELGYAMARGLSIVLVGDALIRCVFCELVPSVGTVDEAIELLEGAS